MLDKKWIEVENRASTVYIDGVDQFLDFAFGQPGISDKIRCPCNNCRNTAYKYRRDVRFHLFKNGFVRSYKTWMFHGEKLGESSNTFNIVHNDNMENLHHNNMIRMVYDTFGFVDTGVQEVEESTRDPLTGNKAPPDEVWLLQHTKKDKKGNLEWSDPKSKEVHEKLHDLVTQQSEDQESQLTHDEMLLQVLGEKSGYFRGKCAGKKAPSKRGRFQENMQEEVQRAVKLAKEKIIVDVRADVENIRGEMRANVNEDIRAELVAELRPQVEKQLKADIRAQMQSEFDAMFQERMVTFFSSMSQSRPSHYVGSNRDTG